MIDEKKKVRTPAVRIRGSEVKKILEELPRANDHAAHQYVLPDGGKASRILMAGMLMDTWSNSEETTRGIKLIDPWGTAISFLASQWTPELMVQIDTLEEQEILMVMAKLSIYDSGERKVQYPKLEAIWKIDLKAVQLWKDEVEAFRNSKVISEEGPNEEFFSGYTEE